MRSFMLASAALAGVAVALPAQAALVLTPTTVTVGASDLDAAFTINYNGNSNGTILDGLTATGTFALDSVTNDGKTFTFSYNIANTATAPVTSSRISIFGFNVDPDILAVGGASATGAFDGGVGKGNVPNGQPDVDVCFRAGGGGAQCSGGGGGGIGFGDTGAGTFTLNFASTQTALTLDNFYIRYQTLDSMANPASSASGLGTVVTPAVPEPATWGMMILGFGLIGAAMRYRHRTTRVTFA